jgi:hypothetical protein
MHPIGFKEKFFILNSTRSGHFISTVRCGTFEKIFAQGGIICQACGTIERFPRFVPPVQQLKQMSACGPIGLIIRSSIRGNLFERGKSSSWVTRLRDCDSPPGQRTDAGRQFALSLRKAKRSPSNRFDRFSLD